MSVGRGSGNERGVLPILLSTSLGRRPQLATTHPRLVAQIFPAALRQAQPNNGMTLKGRALLGV